MTEDISGVLMEEQVRIVLDTYDKVLVRYKFVERRN